jgi:starch synthase
MRILFCASESVPFAKTGGLADVAGALPKALAKLGHDVRLAMPKYAVLEAREIESRKVGPPVTVELGEKSFRVGVESSDAVPGVLTYLIDSPEHFGRDALYGEPDDATRFAVFCRGLLEFLRQSDWQPEVIHSNDWQTGLIPVYLKNGYAKDPALSPIATLHTVHNLAYQGLFAPDSLNAMGLDSSFFSADSLEFYGQVNLLKGGLVYADILSTVSESYSREIQTAELGERLEGVLAMRREDLFGIVNGIDREEWNPATDELIVANYDAGNLAPKAENKSALQAQAGLPARADVPVFGIVTRLAGQKGLDIFAEMLPHLLRLDVQIVLLGTGEDFYQDLLSDLARRFPDKMATVLEFDNRLAHQIYAGSDFFLMPSRYEPCGLGQMISLRYATIPIVRHTGGLADTITEFDPETGRGNGFSFREYSALALFSAMGRALLTMKSGSAWSQLVANAAACDFSWDRSAEAYVRLYERAIQRRRSQS